MNEVLSVIRDTAHQELIKWRQGSLKATIVENIVQWKGLLDQYEEQITFLQLPLQALLLE
jgi:hypothetical protein